MKTFYKIENGQLVSGSGTKVPDGFSEDWSLLQTKEDGSFYTYYNEDGTANLEKEQADGKAKALADISNEYEAQVKELTAGVPESEIKTWTKQELEARAYLADTQAPTPLIDALATYRGVDKVYLVSKIVEKADAYAVAVGQLTGLRQKLEDELV